MKRVFLAAAAATMLMAGCKAKTPPSEAVRPAATTTTPVPQPAVPVGAPAPVLQPSAKSQAEASRITSAGGPRWDWQQYDEESFDTEPSEGRVFSVPQNATKLRVKLTATQPIDAAAMTREVFTSAKGVVREDRLMRLPCAVIGVKQEDAKCDLDPKTPVVYVVRDRRAISGDPAAMALLKQKAGRQVLAGLEPDKVRISLQVWACLANCGPIGGPAR